MNKNKPSKCYLCGGNEFDKLKGIVRDNKRIKVYKCKNCSLIMLNSQNHIDENFYEKGNMRSGKFSPEKWQENAFPDDLRRFNYLKKHIKDKNVVDFGCGAGGFIKLAKPCCKTICGIEKEEQIQDYLNNLGYSIFSSIDEINTKADFITLFHVLEHIKDPVELLKSFKEHLNNDSKVIIEVPNANDALISLYKSKAFSHFTWWSCHLYTFNKQNLKTIAQKAGYKINYIKNVQRYGISNHLYWLIKGKPGGHLKYSWLNISVFDKIYAWILSLFDKTDTIIMSISPI